MDNFLKGTFYAIFVVALVTGVNVFLSGPTGIPEFVGSVDATIDNEVRFLAAFWIAFGFLCLRVARNLDSHRQFVPYIALTFLLSGIGRLLSVTMVGVSTTLFLVVMVLELVLPLVILTVHTKQKSALQERPQPV